MYKALTARLLRTSPGCRRRSYYSLSFSQDEGREQGYQCMNEWICPFLEVSHHLQGLPAPPWCSKSRQPPGRGPPRRDSKLPAPDHVPRGGRPQGESPGRQEARPRVRAQTDGRPFLPRCPQGRALKSHWGLGGGRPETAQPRPPRGGAPRARRETGGPFSLLEPLVVGVQPPAPCCPLLRCPRHTNLPSSTEAPSVSGSRGRLGGPGDPGCSLLLSEARAGHGKALLAASIPGVRERSAPRWPPGPGTAAETSAGVPPRPGRPAAHPRLRLRFGTSRSVRHGCLARRPQAAGGMAARAGG